VSDDQHAWIRVDLEAIRKNVARIREHVGSGVDIMSVVKANAYGHGLVAAGCAALEGGAACLGVANAHEGLQLRDAGVREPILILGPSLPEVVPSVIAAGISLTVSSPAHVQAAEDAAKRGGAVAKLHVKLESGMGRIGAYAAEARPLTETIRLSPHLELEGLATHVGWDAEQQDRIHPQIKQFKEEVQSLSANACRWTHAANSLVTALAPAGHCNLVRAGLLTYGIAPTTSILPPSIDQITPALSIHARITQMRPLKQGQTVSYSGTYVAPKDQRVGLVPVGYGDGYPRFPVESTPYVLLKGQRCRILGVVCMDQFVIELDDRDANIGDEVVLLGASETESISANDLALLAAKIPYEIVTGLSARLPYRYA